MEIKINKLSLFYGKREVLKDISLTIPQGITAVIGRNGSGKSSFINCISGINAFKGEILIDNTDICTLSRREIARHVSVMNQFLPSVHTTAYELVSYARSPYLNIGSRLSDEDKNLIEWAINKAGISHLTDRYVDELSGGELRLAFFAMALAQNTPIMIFDEPTANMDMDNEGKFLNKLSELKKEDKTVICVMHNINDAIKYCDNILLFDNGNVIFCGTVSKILDTTLIESTMNVKRINVNGLPFFTY